MADETKNEATETEVKQTTEVIDSNGQSLSSQDGLAAFLDKVESGIPAKDAATTVIPDVKKEETVAEKGTQEEVKEQVNEDKSFAKEDPTKEVSREKLAEKLDAKKEVKTEADPEAVAESELQVLPHDKPKTAKRIQALLGKIEKINSEVSQTKKEAEEKALKLKTLEEQLSKTTTVDPKVQEEMTRTAEELAMYRRRYELDKDPEVKTKFDSRIESAESSIEKTLSKHKGGDVMAKIIKEEGGWAKFAESGKVFTLGDGTKVSGSDLAESVYNQLPLTDRKAIDAAMMEQITTKRDRERFFEEQSKTATDYFKKRDEEQGRSSQEQTAKLESARKEVAEWQKKVLETSDWLKEKEIPATASAEEKKAIQEDNDYTRQLAGLFKQSINVKNLQDMQAMALDSVRYYQERRVNVKQAQLIEQQANQIKELQEKFDKFKGASRTTTKAGTVSSPSGAQSTTTKRPQSLEEAFALQDAGVDLKEIATS